MLFLLTSCTLLASSKLEQVFVGVYFASGILDIEGLMKHVQMYFKMLF